MNITTLIKTLSLGVACLSSVGAYATDQPISECNTTISEPGSYKLVADLDCSQQAPYNGVKIINTENVKLKMNGHFIRGKAPNNPNGSPSGTGIYIYGSEDVKIDGDDDARIVFSRTAIKIQNSSDVEVEGDDMVIARNEQGVVSYNVDELKIKDLRLGRQRQRDISLNSTTQAEVLSNDFLRPQSTTQALLLNQSSDTEVKRNKFGGFHGYQKALVVYNSSATKIKDNDFKDNVYAISLYQTGTTDTRIEDNDFINNQNNLAVLFGAEEPFVDDNNPDLAP